MGKRGRNSAAQSWEQPNAEYLCLWLCRGSGMLDLVSVSSS